MTRDQLALLLEQEAHNELAEHIRAGSDPIAVLGNGKGGVRKRLRRSRYNDALSRNAIALFEDIVEGHLKVEQ